MNSAPMRIAVLVSGSGSNLQSLIDRCADGTIPAEIVLVVSNKPGVYGLERAEKSGIKTQVVQHGAFPDRAAFDQELIRVLDAAEVNLVCLAGFMRILTAEFVRHFTGRLLNIHPALLPNFPGLGVQQAAIDAGVRFSGCTVHFVDEGVDTGPIIAQAVVPILDGDDAKTLGARILKQEHQIYPLSVRLFAEGRLKLEGRRVRIDAPTDETPEAAIINPAPTC
ncbi:MAG: phosphoribosylglycinamide formyltransferase [Magnetococcales bacterium]|nr:phosphoribosylglycinamide formyltransferase [Magnetococcales bacterium]